MHLVSLDCAVFRKCAAAMAIALFLSGCVRDQKSSVFDNPASPYGPVNNPSSIPGHGGIVTADQVLEGEVASVNSNLRFAVVTFPPGRTPAIGQRMNITRQGLKVGEIKITGPERDDSTVGDIIAGEAERGDVVRELK
jgi:hypothetical protein